MHFRKLFRAVFFDVLLAICLCLWIERGCELARDLAVAYLCVIAQIMWIAALLVRAKDYEHGYPVNAFYDFVSTTAIIAVLISQHELVVALLLGVPYVFTLAKRGVAGAW
ncbi:hypothetical protein [Caballeronia sp. LZ034LL]|uniref:hypothetical protein n=1 Tax=Caballeronia sp. LZ034LL TaxID=3038567 RepID=UPI002860283D|nr:hypothetical protein [Caballeronia sp. LZ034LL]MDR5833342.1 hypothetical protein [Caballeronia sp. LZ034LL]